MMITPSDAPIAETSLDLVADRREVWRALTTGDGLRWWMGDGAVIDAVSGGAVDVPDVVSGVPRRGRVGRVETGRLLEFVWWPTARPTELSTVTIRLDEREESDGTTITVTETLGAPAPARSAPGFEVPPRNSSPAASQTASPGRTSCSAVPITPGPLSAHRFAPSPVDRPLLLAGWVWRLALVSVSTAMVRC